MGAVSMPLRRPARFRRRQHGAVLLMAMLIVVLILMTGITATSNSNAQLKLAGAFQSGDDALNKAESAIAAAEAWLGSAAHGQSAGFATYDAQASPQLLPLGFEGRAQLPGQASSATPGLRWPESGPAASAIGVAGDPAQQYFIEQLSAGARLPGSSQVVGGRSSSGCNQVDTFQITARGRDPRGVARFVQTQYAVLHCPD